MLVIASAKLQLLRYVESLFNRCRVFMRRRVLLLSVAKYGGFLTSPFRRNIRFKYQLLAKALGNWVFEKLECSFVQPGTEQPLLPRHCFTIFLTGVFAGNTYYWWKTAQKSNFYKMGLLIKKSKAVSNESTSFEIIRLYWKKVNTKTLKIDALVSTKN